MRKYLDLKTLYSILIKISLTSKLIYFNLKWGCQEVANV